MRWQTSQLCVVVNYVIQIVEPLKPLLLVERTNLVRLVNLLFTTGSCFYIYIETTNKRKGLINAWYRFPFIMYLRNKMC